MKNIYIFKDGVSVDADIKRLFGTHGPYTIEGKRLDQLVKVQLIVDSSVSTIEQTGSIVEKAKTGSMVGRAVAGAVIAGGAGAVVGGLSGKKESVTSSVSSESIKTDLTAELIFDDTSSLYVQVKKIEAFHWLLGFANQQPMTDDELGNEKIKAHQEIFKIQLEKAYEKAIKNFKYPKANIEEEILNANKEILSRTYKILEETPNILGGLRFEEFSDSYSDYFAKRNASLLEYKVDYTDNAGCASILPVMGGTITLLGIIMIIFIAGQIINSSTDKVTTKQIEPQLDNTVIPKTNDKVNDSKLEQKNDTANSMIESLRGYANSKELFKAEGVLVDLGRSYPNSDEFREGSKLIDDLKQKVAEDKKQAMAQSTIQLESLKVQPVISTGDVQMSISSAKISRKWVFDSYDDTYHYLESEKDSKYVTAQVSVKSTNKSPDLFGVGIYYLDEGALWHLANFEYNFVRWEDYGSYLGNSADYSNDFAHSSEIKFTLGVSVLDSNLNKPTFIVATKEGCNTRRYERFNNPPVSYISYKCDSLSKVLKPEDFKSGNIFILKKFDFSETNKKQGTSPKKH